MTKLKNSKYNQIKKTVKKLKQNKNDFIIYKCNFYKLNKFKCQNFNCDREKKYGPINYYKTQTEKKLT